MDCDKHLDNLLTNLDSDNHVKDDNIKKPISKLTSIDSFMNNIVINKYSRNWSRLEIKLRQNKLQEYCKDKQDEYNLDDNKVLELKNILFSLLRKSKLNKISEIKYDKETTKILEIKCLEYSENNFNIKT
tara:strand:- start:28 stop:417 length:390 start_codon:yes stop_codon:yes gene_type:complete